MHVQLPLSTVAEALRQTAAALEGRVDEPRREAELLLCQVLGCSRAVLLARDREVLAAPAAQELSAVLARRRRGEPQAYISGEKGFWTLSLKVGPAVLIPRPETELLVEWGLACMAQRPAPSMADLGTGSGCIALALASERPDAQVLATDLSAEALAVARGNAAELGLGRVGFAQGSWFESLSGHRFDLIVSNPPYIAVGDEHLHALRHEPLQALTDGADGLNCLREIVAGAPEHLEAGGWLLVEHGYDQGAAVRALFERARFRDIETRRDLGGQERATGGRR